MGPISTFIKNKYTVPPLNDDTIFYEQKHLMEPFGNILFAAEYTNKVKQRI